MPLPSIVRRVLRRLYARFLNLMENTMAPDRDLITTILAALPGIRDGIAARDARIATLEKQLDDDAAAAATDAQDDAAALTPVKEALDAIIAALAASPSTPDTTPDPIPVSDVPAAVDQASTAEAADPGPVPDASI